MNCDGPLEVNVPALTVMLPVNVLLPLNVTLSAPFWMISPAPLTTPPSGPILLFELLKINCVPVAMLIFPLPSVPLSICSFPPLMIVAP